MKDICEHCRHASTQQAPDRSLALVCRRYPPTVLALTGATPQGIAAQFMALFPTVAKENTCGEFAGKLNG